MKKFILSTFAVFNLTWAETLQEVISKSMENKLIKSKEYEVKSIEGEILKSKVFANPEIYTEFGRLISKKDSSFSLTELSISQQLSLYGSRKFRINETSYMYESAKYELEAFKRDFISQIYLLFYEALYNKQLLELAKQELSFSEDIFRFVKKTYELGEISKIDILRSEKDYNLAKINYERQQLAYKQSLEKLSATVGTDINDVEGEFLDVASIKDIDFMSLPDFKSIEANIYALTNQENFYKTLAKPQVSVGFISREVFKSNYEAGLFMSVSLPVFNKYLGEIVSAKNKKAYFENYLDYSLKNYQLRLSSIKKTDSVFREQLKELQDKVIPTLNQQLQLANKSYKLKVITLFELTNIKNEYYQTLRYKLEIVNQLHKNYSEYIKIGGAI